MQEIVYDTLGAQANAISTDYLQRNKKLIVS